MCANCFNHSKVSPSVDSQGPFKWSTKPFCGAHYFQFKNVIFGFHEKPINKEWLSKGRFQSDDRSYTWLIGDRVEITLIGKLPPDLEGTTEDETIDAVCRTLREVFF